VKQTLSEVTGYDSYFTIFSWPLSSAVRLGDSVLLHAIMDVLESKISKRERRKLVWVPSTFCAANALEEAMVMKQVAMMEPLLDYLQTYTARPGKRLYTRLLEQAIQNHAVDCFKAVLTAVPNDQARRAYVVSVDLFTFACYYEGGLERIIALVLEGKMKFASKSCIFDI
jgi:hypothetical protein